MLKRTGLCLLFGVVGAAPACGSPSDNNFSGPAAAGSAVKGGASGSSGESGTAGKGGTSSTGGSATGGTGGSTGGTGGSTGGTGGSTGGTGGSDVGGTGMGGSATQGGSSGDTATGGTDPGTGGTDPGVGGDPGTGGTDPGTGGTDPGTGGTGMTTGGAGGMGGNGGKGGTGGKANCDELALQYADALAAARACNAKSGKEQCTETAPSSLTCGCDVSVNPDNTEAVNELERLRKAGASCAMTCPAIACIKPGPAECAPDGAERGLCRSTGAILQ